MLCFRKTYVCANLWAIFYFWQFQTGVIINIVEQLCWWSATHHPDPQTSAALRLLILNMIKFANSVEVLAKTGFISMQAFQRLCKFFSVKFEYFYKISVDLQKIV